MLLSDVIVLGLSLEWYEGVALVQEIVEGQIKTGGKTVLIPQLHQIQLSADGCVELLGGSAVDEPVRRMGQMLQALLTNSEVPVQLRLVASQATAPTPPYASLQAYADALAFFERPARPSILQGIYARAASAADVPAASVAPTLDAIAPLPAKEAPASRKDPSRTRMTRRRILLAVSATAVLFATAAAVKYSGTDVGPSRLKALTAQTVQASDRVGSLVVSAVSEVTDRVGLGRLAPVNGPEATAPAAPAAKAPAAPQPQPRKKTSRPAPAPAVLAFDLDPPAAALPPLVVPAVATRLALSTRPKTEFAMSLSETGADVSIYSADSVGVSPPVGVKPQLPRQLPPAFDRGQLGRMELVIAPDGTVESAKLVRAPRNVHDSMLLSAAKAWQFRPALKDGNPVRYRKTVWIVRP